MNFKNLIGISLLSFLTLASCKKSKEPTPPKYTDVYAVGLSTPYNNGLQLATLWKNNVVNTIITSNLPGVANAIVLQGNNVYMTTYSGQYNNQVNNYMSACWKNGQAILSANGIMNSITVDGNDVYVAGMANTGGVSYVGAYWKNGVVTLLNNGLVATQVNGIAVNNSGDVYVAGFGGGYSPGYWINAQFNYLFNSASQGGESAIAIKDNNVYFAGGVDQNGVGLAAYWKNGLVTAIPLTNDASYATANAIALDGNDVYLAGEARVNGIDVAAYWKNGVPTYFTNGIANAIAVNNGDVYVAGYTNGPNGRQATYWKNGIPVILSKDSNSEIKGIAVITH
jgi:hypothetical protein